MYLAIFGVKRSGNSNTIFQLKHIFYAFFGLFCLIWAVYGHVKPGLARLYCIGILGELQLTIVLGDRQQVLSVQFAEYFIAIYFDSFVYVTLWS